jgi:Zn-dependent peptidase ImmA (M78 family)
MTNREADVPSAERSVIERLRAVVPRRGLSPAEAVAVAEVQASKLLKLAGVTQPPVPAEQIVRDRLGIRVVRRRGWPTSGMATTVKGRWVIVLKTEEAAVRNIYTVCHELKHALDDPFVEWLYPTVRARSPEDRAEEICDLFAANFLMPQAWVKADWTSQDSPDIAALARRYGVSVAAMSYRLDQLRLKLPHPRCAGMRRMGVAA